MSSGAAIVVRGQDGGAVGSDQLQVDVLDVAVRVADDGVEVVGDAGVQVDLDAGVTYYVYTVIGDSDGHIEDVNLQVLGADGSTVLATNDNSRAGGHGTYAMYTPDTDVSDATILVVPAQRTMRGSYQIFVSTSEPTDLGAAAATVAAVTLLLRHR